MGFLKGISDSMKYVSTTAVYLYGHPNVKGTDLAVLIFLYDNEMTVYEQKLTSALDPLKPENILFSLPYEKMESASIIDLAKTENTYRSNTGFAPFDALHVTTKGLKGDTLQVVARGKDKNGNQVFLPIVFKKVQKCMKVKPKLDELINKSKGVTI